MMLKTVCGQISREELGVVTTHEHVLLDLTGFYRELPVEGIPNPSTQKVEMWTLGTLNRDCYALKDNLLLDEYFTKEIEACTDGWRNVCAQAMLSGIPAPAMTSALSYFDGYTTANLPANLLQAQRDYFGTHTYERLDQPRGKFFHTNWTGKGGNTSSSAYNA